jgi:hypothetical protein
VAQPPAQHSARRAWGRLRRRRPARAAAPAGHARPRRAARHQSVGGAHDGHLRATLAGGALPAARARARQPARPVRQRLRRRVQQVSAQAQAPGRHRGQTRAPRDPQRRQRHHRRHLRSQDPRRQVRRQGAQATRRFRYGKGRRRGSGAGGGVDEVGIFGRGKFVSLPFSISRLDLHTLPTPSHSLTLPHPSTYTHLLRFVQQSSRRRF